MLVSHYIRIASRFAVMQHSHTRWTLTGFNLKLDIRYLFAILSLTVPPLRAITRFGRSCTWSQMMWVWGSEASIYAYGNGIRLMIVTGVWRPQLASCLTKTLTQNRYWCLKLVRVEAYLRCCLIYFDPPSSPKLVRFSDGGLGHTKSCN